MATLNIGKKISYQIVAATNVNNTSAYQNFFLNNSSSRVYQVHSFSYTYVSGPNLNVQLEIYDIATGLVIRDLSGFVGGGTPTLQSYPLGAVDTDQAFRGYFLLYPNTGIRYKNSNVNSAVHHFGTMILLGEENTQ